MSSSTPRAPRCAAGSTGRTARRRRPVHRHGPRVLGGQGDVPRRVRRGLLPTRACALRRLRQPRLRRLDAAPGKPRQEIDPWEQVRDYRHAITYAQSAARRSTRAGSACGARATPAAHELRRRGDRPPRQGRLSAQVPLVCGYEDVRHAGPLGHHRRRTGSMFAADREARGRGEAPAMVPVVDADPTGPVGAADAGLLRVLHRDLRGPVVAQRGDAADASRCSGATSRASTSQRISPDAAADGRRAERPSRRRPSSRCAAYETRARTQEARARARRALRRLRRRASRSPRAPARDWFVEHLRA